MIPTAEELYRDTKINSNLDLFSDDVPHLVKLMIQFAKLHVEAALQAASEKAETIDTYKTRWNGLNKESYIEKDIYPPSILKSYPLENIK